MKTLKEFILEQQLENLWDALKKVNKDAIDVFNAIFKLCEELKEKKFSLDNSTEKQKVFNIFVNKCFAGRDRNFAIPLAKKFGLSTEDGLRRFILSSHDDLVNRKCNISWVKQWDESAAEKEYKKAKENGEIPDSINDEEAQERDIVIYDRWNPENHAIKQFTGKRGKATDHFINMLRMDFKHESGTKYYDCYVMLWKNYNGKVEELKKRAELQQGYDDPNEFN